MSATPEQIAEELASIFDVIRAQAERVRVLEEALSGLFARLDHPGNGGQHVNYFLRWPEVEAARAALAKAGAPQ